MSGTMRFEGYKQNLFWPSKNTSGEEVGYLTKGEWIPAWKLTVFIHGIDNHYSQLKNLHFFKVAVDQK